MSQKPSWVHRIAVAVVEGGAGYLGGTQVGQNTADSMEVEAADTLVALATDFAADSIQKQADSMGRQEEDQEEAAEPLCVDC